MDKVKALSWKVRGKSYEGDQAAELTAAWLIQWPDRARVAVEELSGFRRTIIGVLNGDKAWGRVAGRTAALRVEWVREWQEQTYADWVATLTPLNDRALTLDWLGEKRVEGQPAVGVRVSRKGRRDVGLFFDKKTGLLRMVEIRVKNHDTHTEHIQESVYTEYKEAGGVKRPTKVTVRRDGKLYSEAEYFDFKALDWVDDGTFTEPQ